MKRFYTPELVLRGLILAIMFGLFALIFGQLAGLVVFLVAAIVWPPALWCITWVYLHFDGSSR